MSVYEKAVFNYIVCHVAKMRVSGNNANWEWWIKCIGARGIHNPGILRKKIPSREYSRKSSGMNSQMFIIW